MIDVHSHLVFDVDDGSKSIEDTIVMLQEAENAGFTDVILTPHYMEEFYEVPCDEIKNRINTIEDRAYRVSLNIYQGNEIYISNNIIDLINSKKAMGLNNSRYVLFELPMNERPINLEQVVYELLQEGKIPVIAHPERYAYVQEDPNVLLDFIEQGVLFQANYGSIIGMYGKEIKNTVKKLLKHDMIHFLGSDNHRSNTVYKEMPKIMPVLEEWIGTKKVEELTVENPIHVLKNERFEIEDPETIEKKSWMFWK